MPTYDYDCEACGRRVEVMHGVHAERPTTCDACGGRLRKAVSAPAIVFKGSGWAKLDARNRATSNASADGSAAGDGGSGEKRPADKSSGETASGEKGSGEKSRGEKASGEKAAAGSEGTGSGDSGRSSTSGGAEQSRRPTGPAKAAD